MTRERDELSAYREHLLEQLREQPERVRREAPVSLQVFVNEECVGTLEDGGSPATLVHSTHGRPIRTVELRTATGLLAGALRLDDATPAKRDRIRAGQLLIELEAGNQGAAGTLRVSCRAAGPSRHRLTDVLASVTSNGQKRPSDRLWSRRGAAIAAQVVLATAVTWLVADRLSERLSGQRQNEQVVQRLAGMEVALAKQEQALTRLGDNQRASLHALETEQHGLKAQAVHIQQLVHDYQQKVAESLDTRLDSVQARNDQAQVQLQQLTKTRDALSRELAALKQHQASLDLQAAARREEVQHLMTSREVLNREIAALKSREIEQGLKQQAVVLARILSPQEKDGAEGKTAEITVLPAASTGAEVREEETRPFTFRVSFQDGTSEENIERLIRTIHGRLGNTNSGWYTVEVPLPKPQTPEGFMESLRREKIVKALSLSSNAAASPPAK